MIYLENMYWSRKSINTKFHYSLFEGMSMISKPKKRLNKTDANITDEVKVLRNEVDRLKTLVEMLMEIVVEMSGDMDSEEEYSNFLQPNHTFDLNSAM